MKRQSVINRILLGLAGLVLLGSGLVVLAGGFNLYERRNLTPPDGWPLTTPGAVVISDGTRTRWTDQGWWWPVAIAVLVVIAVLALWWLLAQLRRTHPGRLRLGRPSAPADGVELNERALGDALAADARGQAGIGQATAHMLGTARHPEAHLDATLAPDTNPAEVLQALCDGPLTRARQSTGHSDLPFQVNFRTSRHKPRRTE
ncbi:alkaline shock response membrane anchor protein AmaP [Streptomyces roseus]|uniref:Alkaline shock response membrane anchor protein AmaP n=1 Tax=Streptomyces roseus TaxID=66430 RepID=A0A0J6XC12_9ACTN|nr:alkaline shock response membrane anchor protein AmaP [Streptomyces roseus]KMO93455.1 hypothetical protein ACS04_34780 [Streptomyces roseus]